MQARNIVGGGVQARNIGWEGVRDIGWEGVCKLGILAGRGCAS